MSKHAKPLHDWPELGVRSVLPPISLERHDRTSSHTAYLAAIDAANAKRARRLERNRKRQA